MSIKQWGNDAFLFVNMFDIKINNYDQEHLQYTTSHNNNNTEYKYIILSL